MHFELSARFSLRLMCWSVKVYIRGSAEPCFEATARTRREALEIGRAWCRARGALSAKGAAD